MAPLPSPGNIIRVHLRWGPSDTNQWASRFFLKYTGGPPTASDLNTLCTNVMTHYVATLLGYVQNNIYFTEVAAVDLSSDSGAEGIWSGSEQGTNGTGVVPEDACIQVNFQIPRRYRGGKPKLFLPPASSAHVVNLNDWDSTVVSGVTTAWGTFMSDILADTYSSFTLTDNVNVSFYSGFTVFITPSGRARNLPKARTSPLVDPISNHAVRAEIGSQRRRRTAFTG